MKQKHRPKKRVGRSRIVAPPTEVLRDRRDRRPADQLRRELEQARDDIDSTLEEGSE